MSKGKSGRTIQIDKWVDCDGNETTIELYMLGREGYIEIKQENVYYYIYKHDIDRVIKALQKAKKEMSDG